MATQQQRDDVFVLEHDATTTAAERALSLGEQLHLRNVVASAGFEGHHVDAEERAQLVEILAGRLSFEDAFAQVMATVPAEAFVHPSQR